MNKCIYRTLQKGNNKALGNSIDATCQFLQAAFSTAKINIRKNIITWDRVWLGQQEEGSCRKQYHKVYNPAGVSPRCQSEPINTEM